jgi:superfamily II DNA or RNA helicase
VQEKTYRLPLKLDLDADDEGRHLVRAAYSIDGETTQVRDVASLWNYGFSVKRDGQRYVLDPKDLDALLALRSVCTEVRPTGEIVCSTSPSVLQHLRKHPAVRERPASRRQEVLDTPLEIGATIDYDPRQGLSVEPGYRVPGRSGVWPAAVIEAAADDGYAVVEGAFIPLPRRVTQRQREWLERGKQVISLDRIPAFFKRDLVLFETEMGAVLTERAAQVRVLELPAAPRVNVRSDQHGWLDFQVGYAVDGKELPFAVVSRAEGQTLRLTSRVFVEVPRGATAPVRAGMQALGAQKTAGGYRIPIERFASLEEFIESIGGLREVDVAYRAFLDNLEGFEADTGFWLSPAAEKDLRDAGIRLRPYQRAGIHWLTWLAGHHLHGLLADDMGLGKTIQACVAMRYTLERAANPAHSLILCPKSVIRHWSTELARCYPGLRVYEYIGPNRDRGIWRRADPTVVISTYATVTRDVDLIAETPLLFLVLDEFTRIKNPQAKRSQAVKALNAAHRFALSGTPVENRPAELWSVFDFLMEGHLGKYGTFERLFEGPILSGDQEAAARLGKRVGPFVLRRRKEEVAKDLPDKIEMAPEWVELTGEQRDLYVRIQRQGTARLIAERRQGKSLSHISILGILVKLKQVCDHPALVTKRVSPLDGRSEKFDLVLERIAEIVEGEDQVVVFSQFIGALGLLQAALQLRSVTVTRLHGSVPMQERQRRIDAFNSGQAQVALCSLKAMAHGVNLTGANHVVYFDQWWNPATEDQATDRVHRITQQKTVLVHRVLVADTLEAKTAALLKRKRALSKGGMDAAAQQAFRWTREELLALLVPLHTSG